jgi:hypothetical protein
MESKEPKPILGQLPFRRRRERLKDRESKRSSRDDAVSEE